MKPQIGILGRRGRLGELDLDRDDIDGDITSFVGHGLPLELGRREVRVAPIGDATEGRGGIPGVEDGAIAGDRGESGSPGESRGCGAGRRL
jgi:hypothetical protein